MPGSHAVGGLLSVLFSCFVYVVGQTEFQIGTGIFDITGPAAEVNLVRNWSGCRSNTVILIDLLHMPVCELPLILASVLTRNYSHENQASLLR